MPASYAQERLWFEQSLAPASPHYNEAVVLKVHGALDLDRLSAAFAAVISRHEILRTRLTATDEGLKQVIHPAPPVEIAHVRAVGEAGAERIVREAISTPFDLGGQPLWRVTFAGTGPREGLLAFIVHHVILDGWSAVLIFREVFEHYSASLEGRAPNLAELPIQYADFAAHERRLLGDGALDGERDHWLSVLSGDLPAPPLPFGRSARSAVSGEGARAVFTVTADLAARLRRLARAENTTLFATMCAAFALLLARHAGRDDVLIAAPMTVRDRPELSSLAGLFINTVLLRLDLSTITSVGDLLSQARERILAAQSHQRYPFQSLVGDLREAGVVAGQPLATVMFDLQRLPEAMDPAGLSVDYLEFDPGTSKFDLGLAIKETDGALHATFEYATDLFDAAEIDAFADQYVALLGALATGAHAPLANLAFGGEATIEGPHRDVALNRLDTAIAERARRTPDAPAVCFMDQSLTYHALVDAADELAARLLARGVTAGELVPVLLPRGPEQVIAILALWRTGAGYVPIDPDWPTERIASAIAAVPGEIVLTVAETEALAPNATLRVDAMETARASSPAGGSTDGLAYALFTSGSTGAPRLVPVTHRALANLHAALADRIYAGLAGDRLNIAVNGPLSFDTSVKQLIQLASGHTLHIVPDETRADPASFVDWLADRGIDVLDATPLHLSALLDEGLAERTELGAILAAGEAIGDPLWARLAALAPTRAFNLYGPTECTVDATVAEITGSRPIIGTPIANVTATIVDERGAGVPAGVPGELLIGGAGVADGYLGDATATKARFIRTDAGERVYRTGDRVRRLADGTLQFVGRVDDQIKLRGHRIEPGEVEAALRTIPGIADAVVVADGDGEGKRLMAYAATGNASEASDLHHLPNGLRVAEINANETRFLYEEMFKVQAYFKHGIGLAEGATVLDVGANIGLFSLAAHFAARRVRLHAFEPNPAVADRLQQNLARYGVDARIHRHGVSRAAGEAPFTFYPGFSILSGLYADAADDRGVVRSYIAKHDGTEGFDGELLGELLDDRFRAETLTVPLEPLSAVIAREGLGRIDLLKINVEKAEEDVLLGLGAADFGKIDQIAVEVHDIDGRLGRIEALLRTKGYSVATERDWQLEDDAGTNFYVYARRPGLPRHAPPVGPNLPAPTRESVAARLAATLPAIMVPADIVLLDHLPRTGNGKIDRRALPKAERSRAERRAPSTQTERRLQDVWAEILNRPDIGADDNFFALGGHSLLATRLVALIRTRFSIAIPIRALFDMPTITALAAAIDGAHWPQAHGATLQMLAADPASRHEPFALTQIQEAYWLGRNAAFDLGNTSTRIYLELRSGEWDAATLEEGWNRLIARHDMLRAIVREDGRQQVLAKVPRYSIAVANLSGAGDAADVALAKTRREMSDAVLPADRWPLFEVRASSVAGALHLHISMDALIADATSLLVLFREWDAFVRTGAFEDPDPAVTFRDYVNGCAKTIDEATRAQAEAYWLARVADLPPAPQLPLAKDPATVATPNFVRRTHRVSAAGWQRLRQTARSAGVSASAVLLAAFGEVLARWAERDDFTINLTTFDRVPLHADVARMVGDFTTLTLVAVDCAGHTAFRERTRAVQKQLWSDLDHRAFGGIDVLRALARQRKSGTTAQMPVVFTSVLDLESDTTPPRFGELVTSVAQTPQVWLDHQVMEWKGELILNWDAVQEIFPAGMLDAMFHAYATLVEELAAEPEAWARSARPPVPADQLRAREEANATAIARPAARLEDAFLAAASAKPDAIAVIDGERQMTYGELAARSADVAAHLIDRAVKPNTLVAVLARKGWAQVVAVLGVLRSGAAYLPLDADLPAERIAALIADGEVSVVLTQADLANGAPIAGVEYIAVDALAGDRPAPEAPQSASDLAYVIFTSGSTGHPKGVMIDHAAAWNTVADINTRWSIGQDDRVLALSALGFDLSVYDLFGILGAGGAVVLPSPGAARDPEAWAVLAQRHRVTVWNTVPALMQMLVEAVEPQPDRWPQSLRLVMMSGDWIPVTLPGRIRALGAADIVSLGGATEASIWSIYHDANAVDPTAKSVPYGTPLANQSVCVLGADLEPLPDHVAGELYIGGVGLARGYWNDADKTAASFITHPRTGERLYRTGDHGRMLAGGVIEFLGRRDSQVKVNGYRIELGEIEAALAQHRDVAAAAVTAPSDGNGNRRLVAHIVSVRPEEVEGAGASAAPSASDASIITDPVARMSFQLSRPGHRPMPDESAIVALPGGAVDEDRRAAFLARQSHRRFLDDLVPLDALGHLLSALQGIAIEGVPLPKFRYPSASSLNPVQCYLAIKPSAVDGLDAGIYYLDAIGHRLAKVGEPAAGLFSPGSRTLFDGAAFGLFLVGRLDAISPLYGPLARDFALLEAGYAGQALMDAAPGVDIGLCPIGHVDETALAHTIGADDEIVVHSFVGGMVDPAMRADWGRAAAPSDPAEPLKRALRRRLPAYMVPATFVFLERLPLTANGKVDRGALTVPTVAVPAAEPNKSAAGPLQDGIAATMAEILEQPAIPANANFFDLGANSLHLVQLHRRLQESLGSTLALVDIFQNPTVESLAGMIADGGSEGLPSEDLSDIDARAERARAERRRRAARVAAETEIENGR